MFKIVLGFMMVFTLDAKEDLDIKQIHKECFQNNDEKACSIYINFVSKKCVEDGLVCELAGRAYLNGISGVSVDYFKSKKYFSIGCIKSKDADSCALLANQYEKGLGVRADRNKAIELFGLSCDYGLQLGCAMYANRKEQ